MKITIRHKKVVKCMLRENLVSMDRMQPFVLHAKSAECMLPLQIGVTWTRLLCTYMACELYKSISVDILL